MQNDARIIEKIRLSGGDEMYTYKLNDLAQEALENRSEGRKEAYVFRDWGFMSGFNYLSKNAVRMVTDTDEQTIRSLYDEDFDIVACYWHEEDRTIYEDAFNLVAGEGDLVITQEVEEKDGSAAFYMTSLKKKEKEKNNPIPGIDVASGMVPGHAEGMADYDPSSDFIWTDKSVEVTLHNPDITTNGLHLVLGTLREKYMLQNPELEPRITLYVNGVLISDLQVIDGVSEYTVQVPRDEEDMYRIEIQTNCYFVPSEIGENDDLRSLSLMLYYLGAAERLFAIKGFVKKCKGGMRMMERDYRVDIAKALGIIMMVMGHAGAPNSIVFFRFHMALFFILSGWCLKDNHMDSIKSMLNYSGRKIQNLYIPFIAFNGIMMLFRNKLIALNIYTDNEAFLENSVVGGGNSYGLTIPLSFAEMKP